VRFGGSDRTLEPFFTFFCTRAREGRLVSVELRRRLNALNGGIAKLARKRGLLLADLERLCHGHGLASDEPWFVQVIEPNLAATTAIAEHWHELLTS
jgi:hypothetical protein